MKATFPRIVERARITTGEWSTPKGAVWGLFFLTHKKGGKLKIMVGCDAGWDHVSISLKNRVPRWDEMCWIKALFFEPEECVIQYHPPASTYVNDYPFVLHLWKPQDQDIPLPPIICV